MECSRILHSINHMTNPIMNKNILFTERQHFTQWWLWAMLLGLFILMASLTYLKLETFMPPHEKLKELATPFLVFMAVAVFMLLLRLNTQISEEGINIRFFPFVVRHYPWSCIKKCYVRQYRPVREYGGWGIKGKPGNLAFNVRGNQGLQLELNDGKKILIGTQKHEELKQVLVNINRYLP